MQNPFAAFRSATGKSQDELADLLGVNRATVYRWEKGEPPVPVSKIDKVATVLGVTRKDIRPDIYAEAAQ